MIKLVSESSERDAAIKELGYELAELAAQMMRLAAGGGSITRWGEALDRSMKLFDRTIDGRRLSIGQIELQQALKFRHPYGEGSYIDHEVEEIATQALRLVASRLEGNNVQERLSEGRLFTAIRHLEEARQEWRRERAKQPPFDPADLAMMLLTPRMVEALHYLAEPDETVRRAKRQPGASTLRALVDRKLIQRGEGPMGYVLTANGLKARGQAGQ